MTVSGLHLDGENLVGAVEWTSAPGLEFTLTIQPDGRVSELVVSAVAPGASVTTTGQRSVPVATMKRRMLADYEEILTDRRVVAVQRRRDLNARGRADLAAVHVQEIRYIDAALRLVGDFVVRPRTGSSGRGDARYAGIAALYVDLWKKGESRPVKALAEQLNLSDKTVRNLLFKARERGLLESAGDRRIGGELTDKAKEILDGER